MNIPEISPYLPPFVNQNRSQINNPLVPSATAPLSAFQKREVEYVSGQEGATAFQMAPNSSALLLDSNMNVLWVVATDQNGAKSVVKGYHIGDEYVPPKAVTLDDIMAQVQSVNERLSKLEDDRNGQLNSKSSGQSKSNGSNASAGQRYGSGNSNGNTNGNA